MAARSRPIEPGPGARALDRTLAIQAAKIYPAPDVPPIEQGTILIRGGRIAEVGEDVEVPSGMDVVLSGHVVTAGFWNAHIHFTEGRWSSIAKKPSTTLNSQLADMLTSRGFTTVVDAGSDPRNTLRLRRRIEAGEVRGPSIYTAGPGLYPPKGIPFYLREALPWYARWFLPQPSTPASATRSVRRNIARGADLVKLFTGSYVERGKVLPMRESIARAAVDVAHAAGQLVYAHPSDRAGTLVAVHSGVDVLAHAPDATEGIDDDLLRSVVGRGMAMIPTLKMFATTVRTDPAYLGPIYDEVRRFHRLGGELLFGTDVGYMTDYSTDDEFTALEKSGLRWQEILRMLTTAPARRFGATDKGTIAPGMIADLVVLDDDPAVDVGAFAHIRSTLRGGRKLWSRE